jgi:MtrB/PioB family decaheme-associated outer membrane protein
MKRIIVTLAVLCAAPVFAQTPAPTQAPTPAPPQAGQVAGSVTTGVQQIDNSSNSSKLTEYRDLRDDFFLPSLTIGGYNPANGWFFDLSAFNVTRDDQTILARAGRPGAWRLRADWNETPHNFSSKAVTPYIRRGGGLFELPATVPITFKKLGTAAADTNGVLASDALIAAYQSTFLAPTALGTQTNAGHFALEWTESDAISLAVAYDRRDKSGLKATFAPIGDRPPRTLNIQLTEPVDYRTNDITLSAEHDGGEYQLRAEYLFSDFANRIDTLQWQNAYTTAAAGAEFDVWDRRVGTYGARPLPPDNHYHNATAFAGVDMPFGSRLSASVSYGRLEQDEALLPYATFSAIANPTLPRSTAEALIKTTNLAADYVIAPAPRLNVRAFFRRNDLNNETPSDQWQYVTSDTSNLTGTVSYVNKRVSLPYAWDRQNAGAEATWRLPARSAITMGYERESVGREFREADTTEDLVRAAWRMRPARWLSVQGRYVYGTRDGGTYNNTVTHEGYWYAPSEANDNNNPLLTFDNHPDMRRYDVSDRKRQQFDLTFNLTPGDLFAVSAFVRYRNDDFESDVAPSQPLLGTTLADRNATTPGDQLGLLEDQRVRYGVDLFAQPNTRVTLNAFLNFDKGTSFERSIEFNENNKANPGAIATAVLGPWTRAGSQWTADFDDRTWSGGLGATLQIVPERLVLIADYTLSVADVDITYGGFGLTSFDGTPLAPHHEFAFSSPPAIREDLQVLNLRFEIPIKAVVLVAGYTYESYTLEDWQQGSSAPWVESVGSDTLLRDSSRSYQWGNRLFNLGTYLAPGYDAHIGFVGFRYRF